MRLEQLKYFFKYKEGEKELVINPEKVFLSLNGITTKITLKKSFLEINNFSKNEIKGYSIIFNLIEDGCIMVDEEDNEIVIYQFKRPIIQFDDEDIEENDYLKFLNKIKELSTPVADNGSGEDGEVKPQSSEPDKPFEWSESYLKSKNKLEGLNYKSFEKDGIGFFYKENNPSNNKLIFDTGEKIEVFKAEKIEDKEEYKFEDVSNILLVKFDEEKNVSFEITPIKKEIPKGEEEISEKVEEKQSLDDIGKENEIQEI